MTSAGFRRLACGFAAIAAAGACLEPKSYELPALPPQKSMLLVIAAEEGDGRVIAAEDESTLLSFWTAGAETTHVAVLFYDERLAELLLTPGIYERTEKGRSVPALFAERILEATLTGGDLSDWTERNFGPDWLSELNFPGTELPKPCRPVARERTEREFCWGAPRPIEGLGTQNIDTGGNIACEDDEAWLYFSTSLWTKRPIPGTPYFDHQSVHARARFNAGNAIDDLTLEPVFPPADTSTTGEIGGQGFVGPPVLRHDGREMFFASDRPDQVWWDNELWSASRSSLESRFDKPKVLDTVVSTSTVNLDPVNWIGILGDDRTIIYVKDPGGARLVSAARRETTEPGDRSFHEFATGLELQPQGVDIGSPVASCDGFHLFYHYVTPDNFRQAAVAQILSYDPLVIGASRDLDLRINDGLGPDELHGFYELPDCSGLILSSPAAMYFAEARPCSR